MKKLEGKIAVVTGGSVGIGFAIAKRLVAEGAKVVITGRRQGELERAASALGASAEAVRADVSKLADLDALYATVKERHGRIDVLVANAGVGKFGEPVGAITEEAYDYQFDVNVKGTVFTVQKALPLLGEGSSIILVGSTTGIAGTAGASVYSATKAAIRNLARSWILDLKDRKIRVNVLSPGPVRTPGLEGVAGSHFDAMVGQFTTESPLGRIGEPDEIGRVAAFFASDDSSYVNGAELFADGGLAQI